MTERQEFASRDGRGRRLEAQPPPLRRQPLSLRCRHRAPDGSMPCLYNRWCAGGMRRVRLPCWPRRSGPPLWSPRLLLRW